MFVDEDLELKVYEPDKVCCPETEIESFNVKSSRKRPALVATTFLEFPSWSPQL